MRSIVLIVLLIANPGFSFARLRDTLILRQEVSKNNIIVYKRIIDYKRNNHRYHVRDYFENGKVQMDATYSAFDRQVKEESQCNFRSNTKEDLYREWYPNGQIAYKGHYRNGLRDGKSTSWYSNGNMEAKETWLNGQLHGRTRYWDETGNLQSDLAFDHGLNRHPKNVSYKFLAYTPKDYQADSSKKWPLIIYLHGGSDRGTDLKKIYSNGIPDQIYRGREFPFIVLAPQCPEHLRFSTDNWFENFFLEITARYRVDTNRVYLTGASLGGSGTWYLAAKYPGKFAAIAPICGFTSHMDFIDNHINQLAEIPVWAFHGHADQVVPFEETERIIKKLDGKNKELKFTADPAAGHWLSWLVYPGQELYDWFLEHDKSQKTNK